MVNAKRAPRELKKTLLDESFQEWSARTGGDWELWCLVVNSEWDRIQASLTAAGHWHDGQTCAAAKCGGVKASEVRAVS